MAIESRWLAIRVGLGILLVVLLGGIIYVVTKDESSDESKISSFKECVDAGYPVLETFPRICKLPSGKTLVEEVTTQTCQSDKDCNNGKSCQGGICTDFAINTSCQQDNDCSIIDRNLKYACCWAGACAVGDYSQPNWITVNSKWFADESAKACPSARECGPVPLCRDAKVGSAFEESYVAQCVSNVCQKVPRGK